MICFSSLEYPPSALTIVPPALKVSVSASDMRDAGFKDFERGERGSTAEHLSVIEYKTKKESERLAGYEKKSI